MSNKTTLEDIGLGDAPAVCSPLDRCWMIAGKEVSVFPLDSEENSLSATPIVSQSNNLAAKVI